MLIPTHARAQKYNSELLGVSENLVCGRPAFLVTVETASIFLPFYNYKYFIYQCFDIKRTLRAHRLPKPHHTISPGYHNAECA